MKDRRNFAMLALCTFLHFFVDAVSAGALAFYVSDWYEYETVVHYFALYTVWAFGTQFLLGWLLDLHPQWQRRTLLPALLLLGAGCAPLPNMSVQMALLGLGNSFFHVLGGGLVLRGYGNFTSSGVFVSSGAIGLMVGLRQLLPLGVLFCGLALCVFSLLQLLRGQNTEFVTMQDAVLISESTGGIGLWCCVALLAGCVLVRGLSGSIPAQGMPLWLPCIYAVGKVLGGCVADRWGYVSSVLLILVGSFFCLLFYGMLPMFCFAFLSNMTMPLTLRMLYRCQPRYAGLMFGITATCLLPSIFFKDLPLALSALVLVQTVLLLAVTQILRSVGRKEACHE